MRMTVRHEQTASVSHLRSSGWPSAQGQQSQVSVPVRVSQQSADCSTSPSGRDATGTHETTQCSEQETSLSVSIAALNLVMGAALYTGLLVAQLLQVHKNRIGWAVYGVDVIGWCVYAFMLRQWTWLPFEALFLGVSVRGWRKWK